MENEMDVLKPQFATLSEEHRYIVLFIDTISHSLAIQTDICHSLSSILTHPVARSWMCTNSCKLKGTNWIMNSKGWKAPPRPGLYSIRDPLTGHNVHVNLSNAFAYRPFWSKCAEFVRGGPDKWVELSKGRSSNELVDVLLAEISGLDISEIAVGDLFQAQVGGPLVITIKLFPATRLIA